MQVKGITNMHQVVELTARQHIKDALQRFGVEGAEQTIRKAYKQSPNVLNYMIELYQKILKGG